MASYPRDEFDDAARHRDIVGAHRAKPSLMRRLAPFLAVLVLAPLLAWVTFTFGLRGQVPQAADAIKALREDGTAQEANQKEGDAPAKDAAADGVRRSTRGSSEDEDDARAGGADTRGTADPTAIDRTVSVTVLDGSEDGNGEDVARTLRSSGYRQVNESTYSAADPAETTVYVRSADYSDTASDVARLVSAQIGAPTRPARVEVVQSAEAASSAPIVVVVR